MSEYDRSEWPGRKPKVEFDRDLGPGAGRDRHDAGGRVIPTADPKPPPPRLRPPPRVVQVIVSAKDPDSLLGLSVEDDELVRRFSVVDGPSNVWRLVRGAEAAGYAVVIRSDLPRVE